LNTQTYAVNTALQLPFAIGDIQGCCGDLNALLLTIQYEQHQRPIWFTGDLVNRGPDSLASLRLIKSMGSRAIAVLGNHDLHLLAVAAGIRPPSKSDTFFEILNAPDANELIDWLRCLPLAHYEHGHLLVHAGAYPLWSLQQLMAQAQQVQTQLQGNQWQIALKQMYGNEPSLWSPNLTDADQSRFTINAFTRMRWIDSQARLDLISKEGSSPVAPSDAKSPTTLFPWYEYPSPAWKGTTIVFGHWSTQGLINRPSVIGLDTGCLWGGSLTAMDLQNRQTYSVSCAQHQAPG
jgi:bis(5'-nucleosyl)-tetraphosphatase (symmetrical)